MVADTARQGHLFEMLRDHVGTSLVSSLLDAGFGFDVVDDRELVQHARVDGRELVVGEVRYRAVVLPNVEVMPAHTRSAAADRARLMARRVCAPVLLWRGNLSA